MMLKKSEQPKKSSLMSSFNQKRVATSKTTILSFILVSNALTNSFRVTVNELDLKTVMFESNSTTRYGYQLKTTKYYSKHDGHQQ
ncbi:hypothetical protein VCRA2121O157_210031 [Vibrio crassostreae]|nr:hypothetical protein VCRA2113O138_210077 [Vibrio crassostreae]CAK1905796.1 hypothetical protein VCRA2113O140_210077 [Vibrio crassostreae]CAK1934560.1 hypothetical protein VCRA2113O137_240077 [Vibrio crassostreae]CAK2300969.1 hypothetical protein VCRA2116O141_210031 [Vibrio crassostreae]CAK2768796.1 hypothetical protein VCRA2121O154_210031 [Vibrio crassostreae]